MDEVTRLVSSGDDVKIWNSTSLTVSEQFNPHSLRHPVSRVCWSSNNQYLVSASSSGDKLVVSSLKATPIPLVELAEGKKQTRVSLNSTSQFLVSGGLDGTVNIWDLKTKKLHRTLQEHKEEVTCVSFNGSDSYIASGSTSGDIVLHSVTTNLSSKPFGHGPDHPIHDLKYSYVKRSLLGSVSDSGTVALWDGNTQKELHVFEGAHKAPASGLAFSPANDLLFVTVGLDKKIICYDTSSKIVLRSMRAESPLTAIDFTPDGAGLAVGSTQGRVYLYDLRNLSSPVKTAAAHKTSVTCLRFQHSHSFHPKSSKVSSTQSSKRTSVKLGAPSALANPPHPLSSTALSTPAPLQPQPTPLAVPEQPVVERGDSQTQSAGTSVDDVTRCNADRLPSLDKFSGVGRNSLDVFSPVRDEYKGLRLSADPASGKIKDDLDFLSQYSSSSTHRRTTLGTPVFQTPPPIREEETSPLGLVQGAAQDGKRGDKEKTGVLGSELNKQTTPASSQVTPTHSGAPFCTPQPPVRDSREAVAHLSYNTPMNGAPNAAHKESGVAGVANSLSERILQTVGGEGGGVPLSSLQIHFIRNMIHEALEDFRDSCHRDIVNLQVEMIRQFYIQLNEIHGLIERYSVTDSLVEQIEKLKEENQRLRSNY